MSKTKEARKSGRGNRSKWRSGFSKTFGKAMIPSGKLRFILSVPRPSACTSNPAQFQNSTSFSPFSGHYLFSTLEQVELAGGVVLLLGI